MERITPIKELERATILVEASHKAYRVSGEFSEDGESWTFYRWFDEPRVTFMHPYGIRYLRVTIENRRIKKSEKQKK